MGVDRTYIQKSRRQPLHDDFDMDTGRDTESGSPKNNLAENRRKTRRKKEKIWGENMV